MVRCAASKITARQVTRDEIDVIKISVLLIMICFIVLPFMSGTSSVEHVVSSNSIRENHLSDNGDALRIPITAQSDYIATGNVSSYRGFAYSDDNADFLRFVSSSILMNHYY